MKPHICISGGFDPIHIGHMRMIQDAARLGTLTVIINSDEWLIRKKGFVFMPWDERAEIILRIKGVSAVTPVDDSDDTVCEALQRIRPDYFGNGGDRIDPNSAEHEICELMGIIERFGLGGDKVQSSSALTSRLK